MKIIFFANNLHPKEWLNTTVNVGGVGFTIRGFINEGAPIINSIFIP